MFLKQKHLTASISYNPLFTPFHQSKTGVQQNLSTIGKPKRILIGDFQFPAIHLQIKPLTRPLFSFPEIGFAAIFLTLKINIMMPAKNNSGTLTRRNAFPDFFGELDRFFDNDFNNRFLPANRMMHNIPAINIRENEKDFQIEVAAPGMKKEDFHIDVENGMLMISSEKKEEKEEKEENFTRREYNYSSFQRSFQLPDSVREEDINASYKDGVLMLTIPKNEEAQKPKRRQINIK
jgi:HSP20 family protein